MKLSRRWLLGGLAALLLPASALAQAIPGTWVFAYTVPKHLTTAATTTLKSSPGVVHTVCVNTAAATSTVTIEDNSAVIAIVDSSSKGCMTYDAQFLTNLKVVIAGGTPDVTVDFQ